MEQTITTRVPEIRWVTAPGAGIADGSSWANAMPLRPALATTFMPGDQLWIAGGTYTPHAGNDRTARFTIPEGLRVYGGFAGTETAFHPTTNDNRPRNTDGTFTHETILSGDLDGNDEMGTRTDNSNRVMRVTGADVVLNGLTISGGEGASGAGLSSTSANTAVTNCTFTNNTTLTTNAGGGANFSGVDATLTDVAFMGNTAHRGGGAFFEVTGATLTRVTFTNNTTRSRGGGAYFQETGATLTDNVFTGNTAEEEGGRGVF